MLKFFFIITFFAIGFNFSYSQSYEIYFSGGYNLSSGSYKGLNTIINSYNEKSYFSKKLDNINFTRGFTIALGGRIDNRIMIEAGYIQKESDVSTSETDHGEGSINDIRNLKLENNSFNVGVGVRLYSGNFFNIYSGLSLDFGKIKVYTRQYKKNASVPGFMEIPPSSTLAFTIFPSVDFLFFSKNAILTVKPFYQKHILEADFVEVNKVLGHPYYSWNPKDKLKSTPDNYGIEFRIGVNFNML